MTGFYVSNVAAQRATEPPAAQRAATTGQVSKLLHTVRMQIFVNNQIIIVFIIQYFQFEVISAQLWSRTLSEAQHVSLRSSPAKNH